MKFGRHVLHINTHWLTGSDFWFDITLSRLLPWRHFTRKNAATWWVHMKYMPSTYAAASTSSWSIVPFVLVIYLQSNRYIASYKLKDSVNAEFSLWHSEIEILVCNVAVILNQRMFLLTGWVMWNLSILDLLVAGMLVHLWLVFVILAVI